MGFSHKSHGKRSDKETQSPMLKIFKDMMQKDKRDPEKTNLLKDRHPERKRKHYSGSRSKSGHKTVSSSSDHPKKEPQYKRSDVEARNAHYDGSRSQRSVPLHNEKRESWWFWGSQDPPKKEEDSCSCVSCALKRFLSTDTACICCVALVFIVSIAAAVMLVYRSMPCAVSKDEKTARENKMYYQKPENERLKRKISDLGKWSFGPTKDWRNIFSKRSSDFDGFNFRGNDLASLVESENDLSKILDPEKLNDIQHSERLKDFYKKLVQTDAAIRNLRKSLSDNYNNINNFDINSNGNVDFGSNIDFDNDDIDINDITLPDRFKRSLKLYPKRLFHFKRREPATQAKINNGKLITKTTINMTATKKGKDSNNNNPRNKRFGNLTDGSFLIEKNKVVIQYKPNRKVAKCSHSPKDKTHEDQLNHPFYKNTQRLDELLDQIIDKKIPDFFSDRTDMGTFFDKNKKCKHPPHEEIILVKDDDLMKDYEQESKSQIDQSKDENNNNRKDFLTSDLTAETEKMLRDKEKTDTTIDYASTMVTTKVAKSAKDLRNIYANDFFEDSDGVEKKVERSTTPSYDILLSISTMGNSPANKASVRPSTDFPERPNMRKLQQLNMKEEDGVAYEDLKEVLADYKEGHDDDDKEAGDRKKRTLQDDIDIKISSVKNYPSGIHNPNWKGAMPLYPEELTQILKSDSEGSQNNPEDAINNKVSPDYKEHKQNSPDYKEVPVHNRDVSAEGDDAKPGQSDVEYVEDYLDNGYVRLVELAQAYSDYGVLDEKKETDSEKKTDNKGHAKGKKKRLGFSKRLRNSFKRGMKKDAVLDKTEPQHIDSNESEGIRIEIQPNKKNDPQKLAETESYKCFKDMLQKHVKVVNDLTVENLKPSDNANSDLTTPRLDFKLATTNKYKTTKTLDSLPDVVYKKRTLQTLGKKNNYEATDKMINRNFDADKLEYKRDANKSLETELDDIDKNLKLLKSMNRGSHDKFQLNDELIDETAGYISVDNIFTDDSKLNGRLQYKRDTEKNKEDNDNKDSKRNDEIDVGAEKEKDNMKINTLAEKSLLISQSMEKLQFKRDANSTMDQNENQMNGSYKTSQDKRGVFSLSNSKPKPTVVKKVNAKVNERTGSSHTINIGAAKGNSSLSKLMTVLSNWFNSLDEIEMTKNGEPSRSDRAFLSNLTNQTSATESQLAIPIYEPDVIGNIGHRSRLLLSIDVANVTEKAGEGEDEDQMANLPSTTELLIANNTRSPKDVAFKPNPKDTIFNQTENHVVKRQAIDDSNLIFWNDLYDEDYGVNADPLENNIRDKHSADRKDLLKKSNTWIQDKVRRIANKFYSSDTAKNVNEKIAGSKHIKRNARYDDDEEDNTVKLDLATLTAKMKEICKDTVKAVQETKHIQVREDGKDSQAASSLMQQLVRLMTDLVDFQVQERTCRKLPADLQRFLDWLTASKEDSNDDDIDELYTEKTQENYEMTFGSDRKDKPTEPDLLQPSERENTDSKTDCLGTLHAVQNLIKEYEEMSENDKSLMTGVKAYLENQMNYLQKQLSSIEDKQMNKSRYIRDIAKVGHSVAQTIDATAKNLDKEYKNLRRVYHKYKGKAGTAYKQVLKTTADIKEKITAKFGKIVKTTAKPKPLAKHAKVTQIITKIDGKKKEHVITQDQKIIKSKHSFFHSKSNANKRLKENAKLKKKSGFEEDLKDFDENVKAEQNLDDYNYNTRIKNNIKNVDNNYDQPYSSDKDERNIKDVYFKAVEEAKKATLAKGPHIHDGNGFDKTDVFRISDYVGGKEQ